MYPTLCNLEKRDTVESRVFACFCVLTGVFWRRQRAFEDMRKTPFCFAFALISLNFISKAAVIQCQRGA
jgi:hypothetical protein